MNTLPFSGLRVIDFSWVMAGPMTTKMLGAMGAEIIKIESSTRPEFSQRDGMFSVINNNKLSCTLNFTSPEGQALLRDLVRDSDVVVENFSSRVLKKYNLSYEDLRAIKPDIIFVSASGMGRTGPQRDLLAYGSLLQGYSGRVSMIGTPNPTLEAMGILPAWTDPVTALWETLAILTALHHREATGQGAFVDLSMLEGTVALLPEALLTAGLGRDTTERHSATEPGAAPSGCYRCAGADDWVALSVRTDSEWTGFCRAIADETLAADPRFANQKTRLRNKALLNAQVSDWVRTRAAAEVERAMIREDVPCSRSRHMGEIVQDAHLRERGLFRVIDGAVQMASLPWMTAEGWRGSFKATPAMGGDNDYVFGTLLGLSPERMRELEQAGTIR